MDARRWIVACIACAAACSADDVARPRLEIIVDDLGVPHIYGATDEDAFYGAGYQMASARLYHMDQTRRAAYGRQAEVLGADSVADDELARTFDWLGWGRRHAELMRSENPDTLAMIESWTDGVNARIDEVRAGDAPLPYEFGPDQFDYAPERWQPEDVLVIATRTGFGNDLSFDREIFATIAYQLAPDALAAIELLRPIRPVAITPAPATIRSPTPPTRARDRHPQLDAIDPEQLARTMAALQRIRGLQGLGSNSWVVAGEHTIDGRPLIAGDPHLNFDVPGLFYAQHINSKDQGGTIDAAGFSFVGTPGISVGQTDRIVWTPTTAFADVMDVWTVAMPDPDHVMIGGEPVAVARREEIIRIRGAGDAVGEGSTQSLEVLDVPGYGVILPTDLVPLPLGEPGDRLLLGWTGYRPNAFSGL
ncbi:MAG TPA: penicillin acylase family protein, partial [Nannocystaceae bacterium]|nr:penicillin acylase family protein [Nannocystaceae bacterium]